MDLLISVILIIVTIAVPYFDTSDLAWEEETPYVSMNGCAAYYASGQMEATANVLGYINEADRGAYYEWLWSEGYIGAVAVYRLGDKGKDVHILWPDGTIDGPYISIDVVARNHYNLGLDRNRVIDVDYDTAMRHNMRGPMAVTIIYDFAPLFDAVIDDSESINIGITTDEYKGCIGRSNDKED